LRRYDEFETRQRRRKEIESDEENKERGDEKEEVIENMR